MNPPVVIDNTAFTLAAAIAAMSSFVGGLTAKAAGTQANGTPLAAYINEVTTVATGADSLLMPLATVLGQEVVLISKTATSAQLYGSGTDTVNGTATATGVAVVGSATGKTTRLVCDKIAPAGNWVMPPLA